MKKYSFDRFVWDTLYINVIEDGNVESVPINSILFDQEHEEYSYVNRIDEIDNILMWMSETNNKYQKLLMEEDRDHLKSLSDEYVLSNCNTNEYICDSENSEKYQTILKSIVMKNQEIIDEDSLADSEND